MRIKPFLLITFCGILLFVSKVIFYGNHSSSSLQNFVSEFSSFQNNLRDSQDKRFQADEKLLNYLGFNQTPRLYPENVWTNITLPLIVTILYRNQDNMGIDFSKHIAQILPNYTLLVYDVGLTEKEGIHLGSQCNTTKCQIIKFNLESFPPHVRSSPSKSLRPLIIQDALNRAGAVFYMDSHLRVASHFGVGGLFSKKPVGVFSTRQAVSSLTHPSMMDYFRIKSEEFQFLPMVELSRVLLWNTLEVHQKIMLPWIQCVLTPECLEPIGAQSQGCRFDKKPQYRYSGCHAYDASAFNIILGLAFKFDYKNYTYPMKDTFFVSADLFHDRTEDNTAEE